MKFLGQKICNVVFDFFHSAVAFIMGKFVIVEKRNITEEEAKELLKILEEWGSNIYSPTRRKIDYWYHDS